MNKYQRPSLPREDDRDLDKTANMLRDAAEQIVPEPSFVAKLERRLAASHPGPEATSMFTMRKITPVLLWVLAAVVMILAVDWAIRSIARQPVPAARNTPAATSLVPAPPVDQSTPVPSSQSYDWRGTTLTLAAELPNGPAESGIYAAQTEQHATLEEARALAQRFGINGQAYQTLGEVPGTTDFLITDAKQSLRVRSAGYYSYTADLIKSYNNMSAVKVPQADSIPEFLHSHGYGLPFLRVEWSDWRSAYVVEPLTAENTPLRYEKYSQPMLLITLDENGNVASLQANVVHAANEPQGHYGILKAEEAFQKLLDPNTTGGMIESMNAAPVPMKQWRRSYPTDQMITLYGNVTSEAAVEAGHLAFIQLDGFPVTGQTSGLDQFSQPMYVAATGQLVVENGIERFNVASWQPSAVKEDGLTGAIERQGNQAVLTTQDGARYVLPDVPSDLPMPFENAYVIGTKEGDAFQWKTIDNRMATQGGGGGGGGGGSGFYKLNLSGTPVPFPTTTVESAATGASGSNGDEYTVQAGDTLGKIAQQFGTTIDALAQANSLQDPSKLMLGQVLVIPGTPALKVEGLRGMLNITINKQPDGSQQVTYGFLPNANTQPNGYMLLEGNGLEELQKYNSRPVDIWGTLEGTQNGTIRIVRLDRFEIPFPDLKVQILNGTQKLTQIAGQPATLFIADSGTPYVQLLSDGTTGISIIGKEGDQVEVEAVAVPGEIMDGYPGLRVFAAGLAVNPKTGQPNTMSLTADKPTVVDVPSNAPSIGKPPEAPTATIEKVELVHFMSDPRHAASASGPKSLYFQPVWCFSGHYSNGDEFEILIQALRQQYLFPEIEPALQQG